MAQRPNVSMKISPKTPLLLVSRNREKESILGPKHNLNTVLPRPRNIPGRSLQHTIPILHCDIRSVHSSHRRRNLRQRPPRRDANLGVVPHSIEIHLLRRRRRSASVMLHPVRTRGSVLGRLVLRRRGHGRRSEIDGRPGNWRDQQDRERGQDQDRQHRGQGPRVEWEVERH